VSNVTAGKVSDPDEIRRLLVAQVTGTVRWRECLLACVAMGVERFVELGAGRVLSGLVKRVVPQATALAAGSPGEIETLLKAL
jgi:[acyl-carrier-protein] S-malonyltransferase